MLTGFYMKIYLCSGQKALYLTTKIYPNLSLNISENTLSDILTPYLLRSSRDRERVHTGEYCLHTYVGRQAVMLTLLLSSFGG